MSSTSHKKFSMGLEGITTNESELGAIKASSVMLKSGIEASIVVIRVKIVHIIILVKWLSKIYVECTF